MRRRRRRGRIRRRRRRRSSRRRWYCRRTVDIPVAYKQGNVTDILVWWN
jgi:hypothetical protein